MPECYREQIGRTFLKLLKKHKDTKRAMYLTRLKYEGRDGKMIGRSTVYRHVEFVRKIDAGWTYIYGRGIFCKAHEVKVTKRK